MRDNYDGRFMEEDPALLNGAGVNLYRYVNNSPVHYTDPSGMVAEPNPGTRGFWEQARNSLDISVSSDRVFVNRALQSLDGEYSLNQIPWVEPGAQAPGYQRVIGDVSQSANFGARIVQVPRATPAQLARINIRVNLIALKTYLVNQIYEMLRSQYPEGPPPAGSSTQMALITGLVGAPGIGAAAPLIEKSPVFSPQDLAKGANEAADMLIWITDQYLRTHTGARPRLGRRNRLEEIIGGREGAPWCADWAEGMSSWINWYKQTYPNSMAMADKLLQFDWLQTNWNADHQHNYIGIRPRGYAMQFSRPNNGVADPVILLFDPWRDLLPRAYSPRPLNSEGVAPTDRFEPGSVEEPYYNTRPPTYR